jgi:signal recognition particle subunit SRP54
MLEKLGEVLRKVTDRLANAIFLDKNLVDSIIRELQRALIEADVNVSLVKELSDKIRKASLEERVKEIDKKEHVIKLLHDELLALLGERKELRLGKGQNRIMLVGLYGTGKTTTAAKLGNYFAKRGSKAALLGLDTHRPAASEQLKQLAERNKLNFFIDTDEKSPEMIWKRHEKALKDFDAVIIDTAGRHSLDKDLLKEIMALEKAVKPTEIILVMPADIGQAARSQAEQFNKSVRISGVIITRMDSTAKGGGALTACAETKSGICFITTGEKINDIEEFNPKSFLSRLLGMGDLSALLEKVRSSTDEKKQKSMKKSLEEGRLSLEDVIDQVKSMNSLGGFEKLKDLIPGFGAVGKKLPEELLQSQEKKISRWEHIVKSMTLEERQNPNVFEDKKTGTSRMNRVAKGSGVNVSEIRSLLKQYKMLNEMIKSGSANGQGVENGQGMLSQRQMQKLAKKFIKKGRLRF